MATFISRLLARLGGARYSVLRPHDSVSRERHRMLSRAFLYTRNESVVGDYVEFGIADGRSLVYAWDVIGRLGLEERVRLWGFDAFQGFPAPRGVDAAFPRFREGDAAHARSVVEHTLRRHRVPAEAVNLVEGWYDQVLTPAMRDSLSLGPVRVLNVDCDQYHSAILALDFVGPLLADGAVVLFDDWFCFRGDPDRGEQRAAREWLERNPDCRLLPWRAYANVGQSFLLSRRKPEDDSAA